MYLDLIYLSDAIIYVKAKINKNPTITKKALSLLIKIKSINDDNIAIKKDILSPEIKIVKKYDKFKVAKI